jgi:hypothetical protein
MVDNLLNLLERRGIVGRKLSGREVMSVVRRLPVADLADEAVEPRLATEPRADPEKLSLDQTSFWLRRKYLDSLKQRKAVSRPPPLTRIRVSA